MNGCGKSKQERATFIQDALKVKDDCFAYDKTRHTCRVLTELQCKTGKCNFYKTAFERCEECKTSRKTITCARCIALGLK